MECYSSPEIGSEETIDASDDVMITNDDNADVSLSFYQGPDLSESQQGDHVYMQRSLSRKKLPNVITPKQKATKAECKKVAPAEDSKASTSGSASQLSLENIVDSSSDASTIDACKDSYYDGNEEDKTSNHKSKKLDDILHAMYPIIQKFTELNNLVITVSVSKGRGKHSDQAQ